MGCGGSKEGETTLIIPNHANEAQLKERQEQLAKARECYKWGYTEWLPPHFDGLPKIEMDGDGAEQLADLFVDLQGKAAKMRFNEKIDIFLDKFRDEGPFDDWMNIFPSELTFDIPPCKRDMPEIRHRWRSDKEFGRLRKDGIDPLSLKLYEGPMDNFPVTDEILGNLLGEGKTLASELAAKKLYVQDFEMIKGIDAPDNITWVEPIILFHVNADGDLMPVAIQLQQDPSKSLIFTPNDPEGCWLCAKLFCQQANGVLHENILHLLSTHMIPETFYVAARRNLAAKHPVMELIGAHFWFTLIINYSARNSLMVPGGQLPALFSQGLEGMQYIVKKFNDNFDFNHYVVPEQLKTRGVDDEKALPKFHYRDDAKQVWSIIENYITNLINNFYADDGEIQKDQELQAWIKEALEKTQWKNVPGAGGFNSKAELIKLLTIIIYTVSGRHAAVNNGQFDIMGFVPAWPPIFHRPQMTTKDNISDAEIAKSLPNYAASIVQVSFFHAVSLPTEEDKAIGRYEKDFMEGRPKVQPAVDQFRKDMENLSKKIGERNEKLKAAGDVPYIYLDPKQVAAGVAI